MESRAVNAGEKNLRITVFTPAYNRGNVIEKLYRSLQMQKFTDFEWLVIDDGSTDDTELRFRQYLSEENGFSVRYIKTANGGKHRAINLGVREAYGELFFIVDSDDYVTEDALAWIDHAERTLNKAERDTFAGICGLKQYTTGRMIGSSFDEDYLDITNLEREKCGIAGDKAEVFYTHILRQHPFPEFEGENFMTECVVWDRIAAEGHKMRYYNKALIVCQYMPDGLTANLARIIKRNPKGYALYLDQSTRLGKLNGVEKCNAYIGFCESLEDTHSSAEIGELLHINPLLLKLWLLYLRIYRKVLGDKKQ